MNHIEEEDLEIDVTPGSFEATTRSAIRSQRNLQITLNLRLKFLRLEFSQLEPNPHIKLHVNTENPSTLLFIELRNLRRFKHQQILPFENWVQQIRSLMPGIKPGQLNTLEPLTFILRSSFNLVEVNTNPLVWVSDRHVEGKVVVEGVVVGGVVELGKRGVDDMEFDEIGTEYEPEDEDDQADDDNGGGDEFEDEAQEPAAATAQASAATAAAAAAAVVVSCGWDGRAVVGAVQLGLFCF